MLKLAVRVCSGGFDILLSSTGILSAFAFLGPGCRACLFGCCCRQGVLSSCSGVTTWLVLQARMPQKTLRR